MINKNIKRLLSKDSKNIFAIPKYDINSYPKCFKVTGITAGIKNKDAKDLALIVSETKCTVSGVFTTNKFQAAPVLVTKDQILSDNVYGLVVNSGCANACTGERGLNDAKKMVNVLENLLKNSDYQKKALVMSTGVIGEYLPMEKVENGIKEAFKQFGNLHEDWTSCAEAFMTTDTFPKLRTKSFKLSSSEYKMAGIVKGAGMIHPNMATLLGVILTDVSIEKDALKEATKFAVDRSFNSISVDGDMSTNDTILVMANGTNEPIKLGSKEYDAFLSELTLFAQDLAKLIVRDAEGATKFITIRINNARSYSDAKKIANAISTSLLVKTAFYGQDANWGRLISSIGSSGVDFNPSKVDLFLSSGEGENEEAGLHLVHEGERYEIDESIAGAIMKERDVCVTVDLNEEDGVGCVIWTCDLSNEYVDINANYRT